MESGRGKERKRESEINNKKGRERRMDRGNVCVNREAWHYYYFLLKKQV